MSHLTIQILQQVLITIEMSHKSNRKTYSKAEILHSSTLDSRCTTSVFVSSKRVVNGELTDGNGLFWMIGFNTSQREKL